MKKEVIVTTDGSHSIAIPEMGVTYHSTHGAIQESMHVFIESGFRYLVKQLTQASPLSIFEMGFGTGLNALLTLAEAEKNQQPVYYETVEPYPLPSSTYELLNYCDRLERPDLKKILTHMHACAWNEIIEITPYFSFKKLSTSLTAYSNHQFFNIIYFDAFAPDIQPGLWTPEIFKKLYDSMEAGAVLTTYCSKSIVRKAMLEAGLNIEKIPGPPHKREMVRGRKL